MATISMPSTSTQYVQQQVLALKNGTSYDPTSDTVQMAFILLPQYGPPANPGSSDWHTASWETDSNPTTYWASCLVGAANGGVSLAAGSYQIFVKVTDSPAVPVIAGWVLALT